MDLHRALRKLQKSKKIQDVYKRRAMDFQNNLNNLFDIAHVDTLEWMKIEDDKLFLRKQREPRQGVQDV